MLFIEGIFLMKKFLLFIGMTFFVFTSYVTTQAMVFSDRVAQGLALSTGVVTSGGMILLLSQPHIAAIVLPGLCSTGFSYLGWREYTPIQMLDRALQTQKNMFDNSNIGSLFKGELTLSQIRGIPGSPCIDGIKEADHYELLFKNHISELNLVEKKKDSILLKGENPQCYAVISKMKEELEKNIERMHDIRTKIRSDENRQFYKDEEDRCNNTDNLKLKNRKMDNEEIKVNAKKTEASAKLSAVRLKIGEWVYNAFLMTPFMFWLFAWGLKLPYPRFG